MGGAGSYQIWVHVVAISEDILLDNDECRGCRDRGQVSEAHYLADIPPRHRLIWDSLVTQPSFFLGGRGTRGRGREKRTSGNYSQVFVRFSSAVPRFWHRQSDRFGKSGDRHES